MKLLLMMCSLLILVLACGNEDGSQNGNNWASATLKVAVCTEGEGRDTTILFKNLNDFIWEGVSFSVEKSGKVYTLGNDPLSMQGGRSKPTSWPPEATKSAVAFVEAGDFTSRPVDEKQAAHGRHHSAPPLVRLTHFGYLDRASVEVKIPEEPFELDWSGEISACK